MTAELRNWSGTYRFTARAVIDARTVDDVRRAASTDANLLYPLRSALQALATIGEVSDALRDVWGVYQPPQVY